MKIMKKLLIILFLFSTITKCANYQMKVVVDVLNMQGSKLKLKPE